MRPDRIIVGEVRGKEAFDMMQAMNTGHEGSLTTLHANNSIDTINRLETMILMNEMEIPVSAVRGYIANAIDLIVQIDRLSDGKRKITSISEIDGMKDGEIVLKEIFSFKQVGVANYGSVMGEFGVYKRKPRVYDKITRKVNGTEYTKYYNPMWNFFGDFNYPPGTYYYSNNSSLYSPMWYIFDQVLISKEVIPFFRKESLEIITKGLANKNGHPNKKISDHFPIVLEIKEEILYG